MHFRTHGGRCCGIRQIFGFGQHPETLLYTRNVTDIANINLYDLPFAVSEKFPEKEPAETALQKLDRYIAYNDKLYPSGVLEAVLAESQYHWLDQKVWMPLLEARGFELVTSNRNSNSGNIIHIYHRRMLKGKCLGLASLAKAPKVKPKKEKETA